jgi:NADH:ubiquinone reductase (H+-translocating)
VQINPKLIQLMRQSNENEYTDNKYLQLPETSLPRLVIIGGGFAGMELIKTLKNKAIDIVLVDRHNYHQFQPLLYQVATSEVEAGNIASPFRKQLRDYRNCTFRKAEVEHIDPAAKLIKTNRGKLHYDFLALATGSATNFFGIESLRKHAHGMKDIQQALNIRHHALQNLEKAANTKDPKEKDALTNFVIVGGGPAGVEMAGALAEFRKHILPKDYPEYDPSLMKISLLEAAPRLLLSMSEESADAALGYLKQMGVDVRLNTAVKDYDGINIQNNQGEELKACNLIWSAGVKGNIPASTLQAEKAKGNRLVTDQYLQVEGYDDVFAIGDVAAYCTEEYPKGHPMVAQVAIQQGKALGKNLLRALKKKPLKPFRYDHKGSMATIGKQKAVADLGKLKLKGLPAWLLWSAVHLFSLIGFRNKLFVATNWIWNYFTSDKRNRLILIENKNQN